MIMYGCYEMLNNNGHVKGGIVGSWWLQLSGVVSHVTMSSPQVKEKSALTDRRMHSLRPLHLAEPLARKTFAGSLVSAGLNHIPFARKNQSVERGG